MCLYESYNNTILRYFVSAHSTEHNNDSKCIVILADSKK